MRVIAGEAKGRRLVHPEGTGTRPATDRIRETLCALLEPRLDGARVLDLFAGAGTLGVEALSRGAAHVTFVEHAAPALAALRQNLRTTGFESRATVVAAAVSRFARAPGGPYDMIFCDPPFVDARDLRDLLALPTVRGALAEGGQVVLRAHRKTLPDLAGVARVARERVVGEEVLRFVEYDLSATGVSPEGDFG